MKRFRPLWKAAWPSVPQKVRHGNLCPMKYSLRLGSLSQPLPEIDAAVQHSFRSVPRAAARGGLRARACRRCCPRCTIYTSTTKTCTCTMHLEANVWCQWASTTEIASRQRAETDMHRLFCRKQAKSNSIVRWQKVMSAQSAILGSQRYVHCPAGLPWDLRSRQLAIRRGRVARRIGNGHNTDFQTRQALHRKTAKESTVVDFNPTRKYTPIPSNNSAPLAGP